MTSGDIEFQHVIEGSERAIRQMSGCGLSYSAKYVKTLVQYARALDKNQKTLIRQLVKQQRTIKWWKALMGKIIPCLTTAQKEFLTKCAEETEL